jgi:hypothetical protein
VVFFCNATHLSSTSTIGHTVVAGMVIGKYDEGNQAGVSRKAVEVIRDYLDGVNL